MAKYRALWPTAELEIRLRPSEAPPLRVCVLGERRRIHDLTSYPGVFDASPASQVAAFWDCDEGAVFVSVADPNALALLLYAVLFSHAVVVFAPLDAEWVRRLRGLQELKWVALSDQFCLPPICFVDSRVEDVEAALRADRRGGGAGDDHHGRFQPFGLPAGSPTLQQLRDMFPSRAPPNKVHLLSHRELVEVASSLRYAPSSEAEDSVAAAPVVPIKRGETPPLPSRRIVAACNCGQRQLALRDLSDPSFGPCCAEVAVPLAVGPSSSQWALSTPPVGSERGPGIVDGAGLLAAGTPGIMFGIEFECPQSGHRFFLSDSMARVVMRLNSLEKLLQMDVPLYTKCLACKQEGSDALPAQIMRLHVRHELPDDAMVALEPTIRFKPKGGGASFSVRPPCAIQVCSSLQFVLRLPRVYALPDGGGPVVQREISAPFSATLCSGWLQRVTC